MSLEPPPRQLKPASRLSERYSQGESHQQWQDRPSWMERYRDDWWQSREGQQWLDQEWEALQERNRCSCWNDALW